MTVTDHSRRGSGIRVIAAMSICLLLIAGGVHASGESSGVWRELAPGLELAEFAPSAPTVVGDAVITVLRVDTQLWELRLCCASQMSEGENLTAKQWCDRFGLAAAINAGMFATDYTTHVGYLRTGDHVNSPVVNHYQSVAAFSPTSGAAPFFRMYDLDASGVSVDRIVSEYEAVVQNLRLIKRPGINRWAQQDRRWSEAAIGQDEEGRALLVFCRSPYSMHDLNEAMLALPLGLQCAQHLEGGPEAQLYVNAGAAPIELVGSYETGFNEDDHNLRAWPVPNVIGVVARGGSNVGRTPE